MNDSLTKKRLEKLAALCADVSPERLSKVLRRSVQLNLRVTEVEREEIHRAADALGLTAREYLLGLHGLAAPKIFGREIMRKTRSGVK